MKGSNALRAGRESGMQRRRPWALGALLVVAFLAAACGQAVSTAVPEAQPTAVPQATAAPALEPTAAGEDADVPAAITPSVTVADQPIAGGAVTIAQVVSAGPGWLVIHAQKDGAPGFVLGYSPVVEGENSDLAVNIDVPQATETLYAMLHTDAGAVGTYEFPGSDVPVLVGDQMVNPAFTVTGGLPEAPTVEPTAAAPAPEATAVGEATASPTMDEAEVELEDFRFVPQVLTVKVGTRVKFANKDDVTHTVTSDTGAFDSGSLGKGDEYFFTFTEAGEFPYYCAPHGGPGGVGMSGRIVVVP